MTAWNIFTDSFRFYGRLFNKIFWLSVAYSLAPILIGGSIVGVGAESGSALIMFVGAVLAILSVCFFYSYQVSLIHQFSDQNNDSLKDAWPAALNKTMPFLRSSIVVGLFTLAVGFPVMILLGALMGGGEQTAQTIKPTVDTFLMMLVMLLPMAFLMYRLVFVSFYVIVKGVGAVDAMKASNQQVKGDWLVFKALSLLSLVFVPYIAITLIGQHMIALNPAALGFLQFALGVVISPFFVVFLYRLFMVTLPSEPTSTVQLQNGSLTEDDHND